MRLWLLHHTLLLPLGFHDVLTTCWVCRFAVVAWQCLVECVRTAGRSLISLGALPGTQSYGQVCAYHICHINET